MKEAIQNVTKEYDLSKKDVYDASLNLKKAIDISKESSNGNQDGLITDKEKLEQIKESLSKEEKNLNFFVF